MARLWPNISRVFLLAVLSFAIFNANPAEAGITLFGSSEEPDVTFEATDISVDGDKVTVKGNFKNHTDNFQRVIGYTMQYMFYYEDGTTMFSGAFKGENLSIEVGNDPVTYTVTIEDKEAGLYDVAHDASGWNFTSSVRVEK